MSTDRTAQTLFDQGMLNYYGYLYVQAEYNFRQALQYDPRCGMCYWGIAVSKKQQLIELNKPFSRVGLDDMKNARRLVSSQKEFQSDLIQATMKSFSIDPTLSSQQLQIQYIDALRKLYQKYKSNKEWRGESLALLVDALAYSTIEDDGEASHCSRTSNQDYKQEALHLLRPILKDASYPDHPGLLHTYIHLAEKNLKDPLGEIVAQKIPAFSMGKIAHYTHMPNHIYWRRGRYNEAIQANLAAIEIDDQYFKNNGAGLNSYYYEYHYLHSYQFLTVLNVLTNNVDQSLFYAHTAKELMDGTRLDSLKDYRDILFSLEHLVLARFGKWHEILLLDMPEGTKELGTLFIQFSQALAYLHLGNEEQFNTLYSQIKNQKYTKESKSDYQILVLSYLTASHMSLHHASLIDIENVFVTNNVNTIEKKLSSMNPPVWFFPYSLFLSEAAVARSDLQAAKRHHVEFEKIYPNSTLGYSANPK